MTQHNITPSDVEHRRHAPNGAHPSVTVASHNLHSRRRSRNVMPVLTPAVRTGVRIGDDARKRLRKPTVQPALRRRQPFYPAVGRSPRLLERRFVLHLYESEVQVSAIPEVNSGIRHAGRVAEGGFARRVVTACSGYRSTLRLQGKHEALNVAGDVE